MVRGVRHPTPNPESHSMRVLSRTGPLLLLGAVLIGCDGGATPDTTPINPNLPQVTVEVPGMT